ncbi:hypothetical protein [Nocardia sp. NPDC051750]|uniref:hypothetical protein n=1 Tax=Nocardia sp. NPDC051750 TaxID=3364325 RepID=UPI00379C6B1B
MKSPKLTASETITWKRLANRTQSAHRAVGGRLYLTGERILFEPSHFDALTGGRSCHIALSDVAAVGTEAPSGNKFDGGMRTRLRIDLRDRSTELFVINRVNDAVDVLQRAVADRRS